MEKLAKKIINHYPRLTAKFWSKNWALKLLSFFFAVFLWHFVVGEDKVDMTVLIPVEIVNLPHNLVISNQFKKEVEVTVSGPRGLIRGISGLNISRTVDLSRAVPGTEVIQNDLDSIQLPRGLRVLRIQPAHIYFDLERLIHKDLTIKPTIQGSPAKDFKLESVVLEPPTITLTGPETVLGSEEFLATNVIDITGLNGPSLKQVTLDLKPSIANLIGEPVVTARINISEKTVEKTISSVPVNVNGADESLSYTISPRTVKVRAELTLGIIKNSKDLVPLINATIPVKGMTAGKYEIKVVIGPVQSGRVIEVTPEKVMVEVSELTQPISTENTHTQQGE